MTKLNICSRTTSRLLLRAALAGVVFVHYASDVSVRAASPQVVFEEEDDLAPYTMDAVEDTEEHTAMGSGGCCACGNPPALKGAVGEDESGGTESDAGGRQSAKSMLQDGINDDGLPANAESVDTKGEKKVTFKDVTFASSGGSNASQNTSVKKTGSSTNSSTESDGNSTDKRKTSTSKAGGLTLPAQIIDADSEAGNEKRTLSASITRKPSSELSRKDQLRAFAAQQREAFAAQDKAGTTVTLFTSKAERERVVPGSGPPSPKAKALLERELRLNRTALGLDGKSGKKTKGIMDLGLSEVAEGDEETSARRDRISEVGALEESDVKTRAVSSDTDRAKHARLRAHLRKLVAANRTGELREKLDALQFLAEVDKQKEVERRNALGGKGGKLTAEETLAETQAIRSLMLGMGEDEVVSGKGDAVLTGTPGATGNKGKTPLMSGTAMQKGLMGEFVPDTYDDIRPSTTTAPSSKSSRKPKKSSHRSIQPGFLNNLDSREGIFGREDANVSSKSPAKHKEMSKQQQLDAVAFQRFLAQQRVSAFPGGMGWNAKKGSGKPWQLNPSVLQQLALQNPSTGTKRPTTGEKTTPLLKAVTKSAQRDAGSNGLLEDVDTSDSETRRLRVGMVPRGNELVGPNFDIELGGEDILSDNGGPLDRISAWMDWLSLSGDRKTVETQKGMPGHGRDVYSTSGIRGLQMTRVR